MKILRFEEGKVFLKFFKYFKVRVSLGIELDVWDINVNKIKFLFFRDLDFIIGFIGRYVG